jgi:Tfp pilus assembly protein PilO
MDKLKQYVVFTLLGCLVVLAAGWFLLVSPKRSTASDLRGQASAVTSKNAQLTTGLQVLKAQARDLPKQQAKLAAVAAKIPDNPALPAMIRALTSAAAGADVELVSVTPGAPTLSTAAAPAAAVAPAGAAARPAAATATTAGQLADIPLVLTVVGPYYQVQQFVEKIEKLPRSMRLTTVALAPGLNPLKPNPDANVDDGKLLTATLTGQVFMAVNRPPATAVTVPGQPVAGTAVTPVTPAKK